jgi:hypothetical protein
MINEKTRPYRKLRMRFRQPILGFFQLGNIHRNGILRGSSVRPVDHFLLKLIPAIIDRVEQFEHDSFIQRFGIPGVDHEGDFAEHAGLLFPIDPLIAYFPDEVSSALHHLFIHVDDFIVRYIHHIHIEGNDIEQGFEKIPFNHAKPHTW